MWTPEMREFHAIPRGVHAAEAGKIPKSKTGKSKFVFAPGVIQPERKVVVRLRHEDPRFAVCCGQKRRTGVAPVSIFVKLAHCRMIIRGGNRAFCN
jgi:hypothetical protein